MKKSYEDNIYLLVDGYDGKIKGIGVKEKNEPQCLIGLYLYPSDSLDEEKFLDNVKDYFGKADVVVHEGSSGFLICRMIYGGLGLEEIILEENAPHYKALKQDLIKIFNNGPKPLISMLSTLEHKFISFGPYIYEFEKDLGMKGHEKDNYDKNKLH